MEETININQRKKVNPKNNDFTEFIPKESFPSEFFDLYEELFYDLSKFHHKIIVEASLNYIGEPEDPKDKEIDGLNVLISDLNYKINSIPDEHPIFKNGKIISAEGSDDKILYYVQSGKLRRILNDNVIDKIKINNGLDSTFPNSKFFITLSPQAISQFEITKFNISTEDDLLLSTAILNEKPESPTQEVDSEKGGTFNNKIYGGGKSN